MSDYRRYFVAGGTYFFTLVTHQRRRLLHDEGNVEILRSAIRSVRNESPFEIDAAVILPDHMHFIWSLPPGDSDYSKRIGKLKARFTKTFSADIAEKPVVSESRSKHRESHIWQRRFWEHTITDEDEFQRLFDYIHFNPVKHGHATCPHAWKFSSFHKWVARGVLDKSWGCSCDGRLVNLDFESIDDVIGE